MTPVRSRVGKETQMRATTVLSAGVTAALLACTSEDGPTQPEAGGNPAPAASSAAAASNTWTAKAPRPPMGPVFETFAGVAPNSAGQSIVYVFGGTDGEGTGLGTGPRIPGRGARQSASSPRTASAGSGTSSTSPAATTRSRPRPVLVIACRHTTTPRTGSFRRQVCRSSAPKA